MIICICICMFVCIMYVFILLHGLVCWSLSPTNDPFISLLLLHPESWSQISRCRPREQRVRFIVSSNVSCLLVCYGLGGESRWRKAPAGAPDSSGWTRLAQWVSQWHACTVPAERRQTRRHLYQCQGRGVLCAGVGPRWEMFPSRLPSINFVAACVPFLPLVTYFPFFFVFLPLSHTLWEIFAGVMFFNWVKTQSDEPNSSSELLISPLVCIVLELIQRWLEWSH